MPPQASHLLQIPKHANSRGEVNPHSHPTRTRTLLFTPPRPKMRPQSLLTFQIRRLITYHLALHTHDTSSQPGIDDQPLPYLHMNPQLIASPHPAKSLFNPPARRKRNRDKRRNLGNNSSYRSRKSPPTLTSTHRSLLLHPLTILFYFVDLPGVVGRDRHRNNREGRPPYNCPNPAKRPHLLLMNLQHSTLLAHGVRLI